MVQNSNTEEAKTSNKEMSVKRRVGYILPAVILLAIVTVVWAAVATSHSRMQEAFAIMQNADDDGEAEDNALEAITEATSAVSSTTSSTTTTSTMTTLVTTSSSTSVTTTITQEEVFTTVQEQTNAMAVEENRNENVVEAAPQEQQAVQNAAKQPQPKQVAPENSPKEETDVKNEITEVPVVTTAANTSEELKDTTMVTETTMVAETATETTASTWDGPVLNKRAGVVQGPSGKESYYNLDMSGVVKNMHRLGFEGEYWVRDDDCKMFGDYILVAANLEIRPRGTIVETSLGLGIVADTGGFAKNNIYQLDIATNW